ncbi:hypothetical protein PMAYCL1PPCAC_20326, partial [Pristionchus mayeri]
SMLFRAAVRRVHTIGSNAPLLVKEQLTKLPSGLVVASAEHSLRPPRTDWSHLGLTYRAGTRYQTEQQVGLASLVRANMRRVLEKTMNEHTVAEYDVDSFCVPDFLGIRLSMPRCHSQLALNVLGDVVSFNDCQVDELSKPIAVDQPRVRAPRSFIEHGLRRVAFRGSLSDPTVSRFERQKYFGDDIRDFASTNLVANRAVLYGVNVEHDDLCTFGEAKVPESTEPAPSVPRSLYVGGEWRRKSELESAYVAIGGEGAAYEDVSALAVQSVLMATLGSCYVDADGQFTVEGALAGLAKYNPQTIYCHSKAFEGAGIVTVHMEASPAHIWKVVRAVLQTLKNFEVNLDDFEEVKQRVKSKIASAEAERHPAAAATRRTKQILVGRETTVADAIDNVTVAQVQAAAAKAASHISIAAFGNIDDVPRRGELRRTY